jgi:hypothetical protein
MTDPAKTARQKVLTALYCNYDHEPTRRAIAAAAIRAAADAVVPAETWLGTEEPCYAYYRQRCNTRRELLAIAAGLEGQP